MSRRPPRSTLDRSSAAADVYKRQVKFDPMKPAAPVTRTNILYSSSQSDSRPATSMRINAGCDATAPRYPIGLMRSVVLTLRQASLPVAYLRPRQSDNFTLTKLPECQPRRLFAYDLIDANMPGLLRIRRRYACRQPRASWVGSLRLSQVSPNTSPTAFTPG